MPCTTEKTTWDRFPIISNERQRGRGLRWAKWKRRERKTCVKRHCRLCPEERTQTLSLLAGIRDSPLEQAWEWRHARQQQRHAIREVLYCWREKKTTSEREYFKTCFDSKNSHGENNIRDSIAHNCISLFQPQESTSMQWDSSQATDRILPRSTLFFLEFMNFKECPTLKIMTHFSGMVCNNCCGFLCESTDVC